MNCRRSFSLTHLLIILSMWMLIEGGKYKKRNDYIAVEVSHMHTEECWADQRRGSIRTIGRSKTVCVHDDEYLDFGTTFYDYRRCSQCACFGKLGIRCCKTKLVPKRMPTTCRIDPLGKQNHIQPLAHCMAPLVSVASPGRMCRDRKLRELLTRNALFDERLTNEGKFMYLKLQRENGKREAKDPVMTSLVKSYLAQQKMTLFIHKGRIINTIVN